MKNLKRILILVICLALSFSYTIKADEIDYVDNFKKVGTAILGVGVVGLSIITRGKINLKK